MKNMKRLVAVTAISTMLLGNSGIMASSTNDLSTVNSKSITKKVGILDYINELERISSDIPAHLKEIEALNPLVLTSKDIPPMTKLLTPKEENHKYYMDSFGQYMWHDVYVIEPVKIILDNKLELKMPITGMKSDRIMVPIRRLAENLGAKVEFRNKDYANQVVYIITRGNRRIEFNMDSSQGIKVDGREFRIDATLDILENTAVVPLNLVAGALGYDVEWDNSTRSVNIISNDKNILSETNKLISVYINNKKLDMPIDPIVQKQRTLVPLRAIFEAMGASVRWNQTTKTITATKDNNEIKLQLGSNTATINGNNINLDVPATAIQGNTLVPTRFIAESLGADVKWDSATKSVLIDFN